MPEIYTDEAFSKTNHWELSTSQLSSPFLDGWGYGEVVPDGFGVAYMCGFDDALFFNCTSRVEMPMEAFVEEMERAGREMYKLYEGEVRVKAKL